MIGRRDPAPAARQEIPRCDACHTTGHATEQRSIDAIWVTICVAQGPCIARAKAAGEWLL